MTIRFGTFNLFQFCKPPYAWYTKKESFTQEQWEEKTAWITQQLKKMNCDIVGFQEVFSQEELEILVKNAGFNYFITVDNAKVHPKNKTIFTSTTVALASKYKIIETKEVKTNGTSIKEHNFTGHFVFSRKPIKAFIELANQQRIAVYVNHFKSNRLNEFEYIFDKDHTFEYKKEKITHALHNNYSPALRQRLIEASSLFFDCKRTKTPIVFLCDLNDKEFSFSIDALTNKRYHDNRIKKNSPILFDAYHLSTKKAYNPHPEKKSCRTPTSYYQSYGNVIDYIFVSKELKSHITNYEVFDSHLMTNKDGSLLQSDHAQVVCEISF